MLGRYICMTQYDETFNLPMAYGPEQPQEIFPEVLSQQGLKQLRSHLGLPL